MSEVSTSPAASAAPAAESSAPISSGVDGSAAVTGTDSVVESPASSGELMASTETPAESISAEAPEVMSSLNESTPAFNPESWDGNIDALPENLRGPIQYLHRQLEGGYTKKFQELSAEKEQFERDRTSWKATSDNRSEESNFLQTLMSDEVDPRIAEMTGQLEEYKSKMEALQGEYDGYKETVDADLNEQADIYAQQFRDKNADIFDSEEKRTQLSRLLSDGWDPESGVKLVGQSEEVLSLATDLLQRGTPSAIAVEHALLSLNAQARTPRPAARLISGAESRNNPESASQESFANNDPREARFAAARAAMQWKQQQ